MSHWDDQIRRILDAHMLIIAAAGETDALLQAVVAGARIAMPRASGAIIEMRDGDELVYRAASGSSVENSIGLRLPLRGSLSGRCLESGEAQLCRDSETDPKVDREACRKFSVRSMIVAPIPAPVGVVGVLKVFSNEVDAFGTDDVLTTRLLVAPIAFTIVSAAQAEISRDRDVLARRFRATFDQAAVGMAHVAPDGRFLRVNDRFCEVAGRTREELYRCGFHEITHPDDLEADLALLEELGRGKIDHYQMEKRYIRPDGSIVWINLTTSMVSQADGDTDFFVAVVEDISARRHAEGLASHDALTGLPNRRAMLRKLSAALDALSEADKPLAVAYLDLDRFKQVNDRLGHLVGDRCLVTVSAVISEVIRDGDALYRIAGDEFVLLLSGADVPEAERILARVQKAVLDEIALFDWGISVSAGAVVLAPGTRTSADEVIEAADRLMYAVKRGDEATRTVLPFGASMKPAAARS